MNYLDLFSGIGGFALGAYRAGWRFNKHYYSETDEYACQVYEKRFPGAINLGDARHIAWMPGPWFITGGFPCQAFSHAARGRQVARDLWPEMARIIRVLKPRHVIAENVSLKAIKKAQGEIGGQIHRIPASSLGAAHYRPRYWLVAHPYGQRKHRQPLHEKMASIQVLPEMAKWKEEPTCLMGMATRVPHRVDRFRCLGNSVMPDIAMHLFLKIGKMAGGSSPARMRYEAREHVVNCPQASGGIRKGAPD